MGNVLRVELLNMTVAFVGGQDPYDPRAVNLLALLTTSVSIEACRAISDCSTVTIKVTYQCP